MDRWVWLCSISLAVTTATTTAQSPAEPHLADRSLVRDAISIISKHAMGSERVDWPSVERELVPTVTSIDSAHAAVAAAVAKLNDPHARFTPPPRPAPAQPSEATPASRSFPASSPIAPETPTPSDAARPVVPKRPEGRLLDDGVAYLVVPGCSAPDVDGLREYAATCFQTISNLCAHEPRAWLIDLRLNGGGNLWPMLLGLRPLLGDGPHMSMVKGDTVESRFGVDARGAWIHWEGAAAPEVQLAWGDPAPASLPRVSGKVAVLIGPWTMSSGESLAICLRGRERTRTFGENTAGLTTVTNAYPLSDGSILNLPVSRMGDKSGREVLGAIAPAQLIPQGSWPTADDDTARAARAWALQ